MSGPGLGSARVRGLPITACQLFPQTEHHHNAFCPLPTVTYSGVSGAFLA